MPGFTLPVSLSSSICSNVHLNPHNQEGPTFISLHSCSHKSGMSLINQTDLIQQAKIISRASSALDRTSCQTCPVYFAGEMLTYPREQRQPKHIKRSVAFCRRMSVTTQKLPKVLSKGCQTAAIQKNTQLLPKCKHSTHATTGHLT